LEVKTAAIAGGAGTITDAVCPVVTVDNVSNIFVGDGVLSNKFNQLVLTRSISTLVLMLGLGLGETDFGPDALSLCEVFICFIDNLFCGPDALSLYDVFICDIDNSLSNSSFISFVLFSIFFIKYGIRYKYKNYCEMSNLKIKSLT
jgi:hypothetical protein